MGFYSDVKPGEPFRPSASLSNDVRHLLNQLNGFGGGVNPAAAPGIVRIPVYNSTSAVLSEGKAVSIDISGIIAGECYPVIAFSDEIPCYGVLAKDLNPAEVGDCILSGLAVVQISSTPATGNYATPGTGGVFVRGDEGVPIVNISGTAAVVMLGGAKGGGGTYIGGDGINSDLLSGGTISTNFQTGNGIQIAPVSGSTNGAQRISADIIGEGGNVHVNPGQNGELRISVDGGTVATGWTEYVDISQGMGQSGLYEDTFFSGTYNGKRGFLVGWAGYSYGKDDDPDPGLGLVMLQTWNQQKTEMLSEILLFGIHAVNGTSINFSISVPVCIPLLPVYYYKFTTSGWGNAGLVVSPRYDDLLPGTY